MKYLLTLFISTFFFALTFASAPEEFTPRDRILLICMLSFVIGVQILIAHALARYRTTQNFILAGFTVINILYANLVLNDIFIVLPGYAQILALLLAFFIIATFFNMLGENTRIAMVLPVLFVLATVGVLAQSLFFN